MATALILAAVFVPIGLAFVIGWRSALPFVLSVIGLLAALSILPDLIAWRLSGDTAGALLLAAGCFGAVWLIARINNKVDSWQERTFNEELQSSRTANPHALFDMKVAGRRLVIDQHKVMFGRRTMEASAVTRVRFCNMALYVNGLGNFRKTITLSDNARKLVIECAGMTGNRRSELLYGAVSDAIWSVICVPTLHHWSVAVLDGRDVRVGKVRITRDGLRIAGRAWGERFCAWPDLTCRVENGKMYLGCGHEKNLAKIDLNHQDNALLLHTFIRAALESPRLAA